MSFKKINTIAGWVVFAIALLVYTVTMEKTASFWDCGEFIAGANKLQVVHPPGAPLWLMIGRLFSMPFGENAALGMNFLSALSTAFAALFLFWSITIFAKRLIKGREENTFTSGETIAIIGSGIVGALAFVFQDSQWFNAVEAEVYALSTCLTAAVFWLALKWSENATNVNSDKLLIAIAYVIGLSIGVHLLNLLVIPAIALLIYFFKSEKATIKGGLISFILGMVALLAIQYGIILELPEIGSGIELFFVNSLGLPFGVGMLAMLFISLAIPVLLLIYAHRNKAIFLYAALGLIALVALSAFLKINTMSGTAIKVLVIFAVAAILYSFRARRAMIQKVSLSFLFIVIGYLSYLFVPIRSAANPPIDLNNPDNAFSLLSYLKREQYGNRPLLYGPLYTSEPEDKVKNLGNVYAKVGNRYKIVDKKTDAKFASSDQVLFPRAWQFQGDKKAYYNYWLELNRGETPSYTDNLKFFFTYQLDFMYWRYFMWNFAGRQNSIQGEGDGSRGNWASGIAMADSDRIIAAAAYPDTITNQSTNHFYLIPFVLGLIGLVLHFYFSRKDAFVLSALFLLTGIAIVVYLNQEPQQARERDYAYVGSFMAYAVWIGLSVAGLFKASRKLQWNNILTIGLYTVGAFATFFAMGLGTNNPTTLLGILVIILILFGLLYSISMLLKNTDGKVSAITLSLLALIAPALMAFNGWDDHNRHELRLAEDVGGNYLSSLAPNAILFTEGDNDTYPLWYNQEVKKVRPDVRMVNNSLLKAAWYADQIQQHNGHQPGLKLSLDSKDYTGKRDVIYYLGEDRVNRVITLQELIKFIKDDTDRTKIKVEDGVQLDILPIKQFVLPVDLEQQIKNKLISSEQAQEADAALEISLSKHKNHLIKDEYLIYDIIARNFNKRPIYFTSESLPNILGLDPYIIREGGAFRLYPSKHPDYGTKEYSGYAPRVNYDKTLNYFKEHYKDGNIDSGVYLEETAQRQQMRILDYGKSMLRHYATQNEKGNALETYNFLEKNIYNTSIPKDNKYLIYYNTDIIDSLFKLGLTEQATALAKQTTKSAIRQLTYAGTATQDFADRIELMKAMPEAIASVRTTAREYNQQELLSWIDAEISKFEQLIAE